MEGDYKVYMHITPSGKRYIGITSQKVSQRWGVNGYRVILFTGLTKEQAEQKEIELIKQYKSNNKKYGYNIQNGGNCCGTLSDETKRKISESNKGKKKSTSGWLGKHHSPETCEKLRKLETQRWLDPEYRANQVKKRLGKTPWNKGKKTPLEIREKQSKAKFGRELSLEEKEALRQRYLGLSTPGNTKKVQCGAGVYSGANNPRSRKVINLDTGKIYESIGLAAKHLNVANGSHIVAVCKGKRKIAHGYHWKYADEKTE